jgi:fructose-specific component phosphotransferase system IIB-like protein
VANYTFQIFGALELIGKNMNARITVWSISTLIMVFTVMAATGCVSGAKEIPMNGVKIVKLDYSDFPDPNEVRGILVCGGRGDFHPGSDDPELASDDLGVAFLVGDRKEMQRLLGRELDPMAEAADPEAVRRISQLYAQAVAQAHANWAIGCTQRIVFVTEKVAYIRAFKAEYGHIIEPCMMSGVIWREFRKIGGLEWRETDANAPSFVLPHMAPVPDAESLVGRGIKVTDLGKYEFPAEEVRGILIYAESNLAPERRLEDRDLCLVVGDKVELEKKLNGKLKPRLMVADPNAVQRISRLYPEALAYSAEYATRFTDIRRTFGTAWTILFVTDKSVYARGFAGDSHRTEVYDDWMKSPSPGLWREFVKIGYLKETPSPSRGHGGPKPEE